MYYIINQVNFAIFTYYIYVCFIQNYILLNMSKIVYNICKFVHDITQYVKNIFVIFIRQVQYKYLNVYIICT